VRTVHIDPPAEIAMRDGLAYALFLPPGRPLGGVVVLHGAGSRKESHYDYARCCRARGLAAIAVDQRGQWESPMPDDPDLYTVESLAEAVLTSVHELGTPLHLVGHSFGGIVTRAALLREPDIALSFTLLGSGPAALGGQRASVLQFLRPVLEESGIEGLWAASEAFAEADPRRRDVEPEVKDFLRSRFLAQRPIALTAMADAMLSEPDRVDELKAAFGRAVLVAHGAADDAWSPEQQCEMAARLVARYEVITGSVHSPAAENPEHTADLLDDFWSTS